MSTTRRSARIKASRSEASGTTRVSTKERDEDDLLTDSHDEKDGIPTRRLPSSKKRKTLQKGKNAPANKKKRGGKLRNLPDMPLDILFEIFRHLLPYDLLRLSRATKTLRGILMQRSSASVWKRARSNVPTLPDCPSDLSEPAYASLAFDIHCNFCGSPGVKDCNWYFYEKDCRKCFKSQIDSYHCGKTLRSLCAKLGITPDRALTDRDLDFLPPIRDWDFRGDQLVPLLRSYATLENEEQRVAWKNAKKAEKEYRDEFDDLARSWARRWNEQKQKDIEEAKKQRGIDILDRMRAEGWSAVVDQLNWEDKQTFQNHRLVKQNRRLTDRIWNNIRPEIVELFEGFGPRQQERAIVNIQRQRFDIFKEAFNVYCTTVAFNTLMAPLREIALHPAIEAIILNPSMDLYEVSDYIDILCSIAPQVTKAWQARFDQYLIKLLGSPTQNMAQQTSILRLATSLFYCSRCRACHLTYEQVLTHRCTSQVDINCGLGMYPSIISGGSWNTRIPHIQAFQLCGHQNEMKALLQACGLPEDATMDTLKELNPLVECLGQAPACSINATVFHRHAMYWHRLLSHPKVDWGQIKVLNFQDLTGIMFRNHEDPGNFSWFDSAHEFYGCRHCYSPSPLCLESLKEHLLECHRIEIQTAESMEHYVLHPALPTHRLLYDILYIPLQRN